MLVRILLLMSRPSADHAVLVNVPAAIDKLTLARHVADFPKTCQTRPTSPSISRPTTGSSSQRADAEGLGLARRAVLVAAEVLSQVRRGFGRAFHRFLTRF